MPLFGRISGPARAALGGRFSVLVIAAVFGFTGDSWAQLTVGSQTLLNGSLPPLENRLDVGDRFGSAITNLGRLNPDFGDFLAIGSPLDDDGGVDRGAFYIVVLNQDGSVNSLAQKISELDGDFTPTLADGDRFGSSLAALPDFAGTGIAQLAVGAPFDSENGARQGAIYIVLVSSNARISDHLKLTGGGLNTLPLNAGDQFGASVADFGEIGNNTHILAVGATGDDDGPDDSGAVWILFLDSNRTIKEFRKISSTSGNFGGILASGDLFGASMANLGDLDNDGIDDIAVGAPGDDDGGRDRGAVWIIFRNSNGTAKSVHKISDLSGGFSGVLADGDNFGMAVSSTSDLDQDGINDLLVGAPGDDDGENDSGALWALTLFRDGTVKTFSKVSNSSPGFEDQLGGSDRFGTAVADIGDVNGDSRGDVLVGAPGDSSVPAFAGSSWLINAAGLPQVEITDVSPGIPDVGMTVHVSANVSVFTGSATATISFRRAGEERFLTASGTESSPGSGSFDFELPPETFVSTDFSDLSLAPRGAEYFISAVDEFGGNSRFPPTGIFSVPVSVPAGIRLPHFAGSDATAYRLISVPLDLQNESARVLFEDDLGSYNSKNWRFFDHLGNDQYLELGSESIALVAGKSYWLLVRDPNKIINTGSGSTVPTSQPFVVALEPGWNFVANPYNFDVPLAGLTRRSPQPVALKTFNGSNWVDVEDTLSPFGGYILFNDTEDADTLMISSRVNPSAPKTDTFAGKVVDASKWSVSVSASQGMSKDVGTRLVANPASADLWDPLDQPEPPVIGEYISVYFPHSDWDHVATRYDVDARPVSQEGSVWSLEIISSRGGVADLTFSGVDLIPSEFDVWLRDEYSRMLTDLRAHTTVAVSVPSEGVPARFSVIIGTQAFTRSSIDSNLPELVNLYQNYPNPFRESTTITFDLPDPVPVRLEIYNVLGQKVIALVKGSITERGRTAVIWDGRNAAGIPMASGVYFVRLQASGEAKTRELLLIR